MKVFRFSTAVKLSLLILTVLSCMSLQAQFAGGSGTENDPYLIQTAAQLDSIRYYLYSSFRLIADINLNVPPYNESGGWNPVGHYEGVNDPDNVYYQGNLDGDNHIIYNLYINRPDMSHQGLFSAIYNADISNVQFNNTNITASYETGTLAAAVFQSDIYNCCSSGSVECTGGYIGGLISACDNSTISFCHYQGTVAGSHRVGGLIGNSSNSSINDCHTTGQVSGNHYYIGGLIGYTDGVDLTGCFSESDVTLEYISGDQFDIGGLVGGNTNAASTYTKCYAAGNVTGYMCVGGLGGHLDLVILSDCYARGIVSGTIYVGGLIGTVLGGSMTNCYATGNLPDAAVNTFGGLVGIQLNPISVVNSYWDTDTTGMATSSGGGEGRTTAEMTYPYALNTYLGWDFGSTWSCDALYSVNDGYPYLQDLIYHVATPIFDPRPGSYNEPLEVVIQSDTPEAEIYYTLDGSEPTEQSTLYTDFLDINSSVTIRARAYKDGWLPSAIAEGEYVITVSSSDQAISADVFRLNQVFPNPFSQSTEIRFFLPKSAEIKLAVYNSRGQLVTTLTHGNYQKGEHAITWDGKSDTGQQVANGIYLVRLQGTDFSISQKLMVLK
jgi:hypothetical protein